MFIINFDQILEGEIRTSITNDCSATIANITDKITESQKRKVIKQQNLVKIANYESNNSKMTVLWIKILPKQLIK